MLHVSYEKLATAVGVSRLTVLRWVQTGWLKGKDGFVELDSLPRLIQAHALPITLEDLKAVAIERVGIDGDSSP